MKSHASMNRIYRLVWNAALSLWVAVAENAKGRGKGGSPRSSVLFGSTPGGGAESGSDGSGFTLNTACRAALVLLTSLAAVTHEARAADAANASVTAGAGNVSTLGNTTAINQASQRLAIDWTSLSTRANEALVFSQPNASAIALNRIIGSSPSEFLGSLTANGQVFILNPNGVLFGAGSQVNVGGLVASTLNMSNADFMAGNNVFTNSGGNGSVVNQGTMTAANGGYLALLAPEVRNEGVMTASLGTALLAAGNKVTLNLDNGSLLGYSIDQGAINALAENKQLIQADGGQVLLSAKAMDALTTATVNNTGVIEARTIQNKAGRIMLMGDMETGTVNVAGTLDASAPNGGDGGFIETSAAHVKVAAGTRVTTQAPQGRTGKWLIDPQDYTIAASGGDMTGATLSANLGTTDVELQSSGGGTAGNGDIHVNDDVSWSANTLTLTAARDININAVMTASGNSALTLNTGATNGADAGVAGGTVKVGLTSTGFTGRVDFARNGTGFLTINGNGYTVINSLGGEGSTTGTDLQGMNGDLNGYYALGANIDASVTSAWNGNAGFDPIGNTSNGSFNGRFNGLGHTVSSLTLDRSAQFVGLFGGASGAQISNVGLVGGSVRGVNYVGGLVGYSYNGSTISNSYATGDVSGGDNIGGLVGQNTNATISNSYATGDVSGGGLVGGLVGSNSSGGTISNSYATGDVSGGGLVGGLVGSNDGGTISNSYATGDVSGGGYVGGLVGSNSSGGTISNSYAMGDASCSGYCRLVGGLVGQNTNATISNSYAMGDVSVSSGEEVGGLVGQNTNATISNSYATGDVSGSLYYVGGLAGSNDGGTISNSYAIGNVVSGGSYYVGGLVGWNSSGGTISNSYATGDVSGSGGANVGGLVGSNDGGTISNSYATGDVSGAANVGGLAGSNDSGTISNSYATGDVSGGDYVGGLIGYNGGTISDSYATTGTVTGGSDVGGLIGYNNGTISNSYHSATANPGLSDAFGTGKTDDELKRASTFAGWDIATTGGSNAVWRIYEGHSMPLLRSFLTPLNLADAPNVTQTYNGTTQTAAATTLVDANLLGAAASGRNAGLYNGYYSTQQGYDISGGNLTITQANLVLTTANVSKTYNGQLDAAGTFTATGSTQLFDTDTATGGSFAFLDKNAGTGKTVTVGGATLNDGNSGGNYNVSYADNTSSTITPKALTYSTTAANKTYDGDSTAAATLSGLTGLIGTETVTATSTGATFNTKDVVTANLVTVNSATLADGSNGGLAGNYSIAAGGTAAANITAKALTYSTTAANKTYDGDTTATATLSGLTGLVGTETVTASSTGAAFNAKDVATANLVTVNSATLADGANGGLASNYSIAAGGTAVANITAKALTYSMAAANKTYDGDNTATATLSGLTGLVGTETVTASAGATFNTKDVATANLVTVNSATLADGSNGGLASNYSIAAGGTAVANITAKALTYSTTAANKTYDGDTTASASLNLIGLVNTETLGSTAGATFNTKDVATANLVTVNSATLADGSNGGLASNYSIAAGGTAAANITAKALTYSTTAANKTYDGDTTATATLSGLTGLVGTETVTASAGATFNTKDVLTANLVTVNSATLADGTNGGLASNYSIAAGGAAAANITAKALTYSTTASNKTYDGDNTATATLSGLTGLVGTETVTASAGATFNTKDVATADLVTVNSATLANGTNGGLASNYSIAAGGTAAANVTAKALTYSTAAANKTYDGDNTATATLSGLTGLVGTETVTASSTSATFNTKNVATANLVTVNSATLADGNNGGLASNYSIAAGGTAAANITAKALTYSTAAANKTYDGDNTATATLSGLTGLVGSETVTASAGATFNTKDVLTANLVTVNSATLADGTNGGLASNYSVAAGGTAAASITAKALTYSTAAANKTYDGDAAAVATLSGLTGLAGTEIVTANGTATFNSKDVLTANLVTVNSATLADGSNGGLASNYSIVAGGTAAATIAAKALTYSTAAANKTYDGNATAAATLSGLTGLVGTETVTASAGATFNTKDVATANLVTVNSATLANGTNGGLASNYSIAAGGTAAASITAKALTYSTAAANKTYDGDSTATATLSGLTGLVGTETVTASADATFNTKDVATANLVTVNSATLADGSNGGLASNYSVAAGGTAAANITAKALTYSTTASNKTYDGDSTATATLSGLTGLVGTETVTASAGATFNTKDVLTANLVTVNSATLANGTNGGLASNYSIAAGGTAVANITAKALTYSTAAANKTYDGDNTATATLSGLTGLVGTETVTASAGATFNTKDVATANLVTVNSATLADGSNGGLASNYSIAAGGTAVANITAKALTYSTTAANKTYDGDTTATATLSGLTGLVGIETVTASAGATFNTKDVLTANLVTVNSATLADGSNGGLAGNYSIAAGGTAAANITAKALAYSTTAANKTYDGNATAAATLSALTGLVGTETVTANGTATFNSKDVLAANTVTVNSATLADGANGGLASNYSIVAGGTAVANITAKALTYSTAAANKEYDGSVGATATISGLTGLVGAETVSVAGNAATFNSKDVLVANLVTVNSATLADGSNGGLASNYSVAAGGTAAANITAKALTYSTAAANKTYDGNTTATATLSGLTGLAGTETVNANGTATFNSKDVATANLVTVNSATLADGSNGGLASNYSIAAGGTAAANITARDLTVTAAGVNKVYDGTTAATVGYGDNRVAGDVLGVTGTASFADKNAGVGKTVGVNGISTSGTDAGNYNLLNTTTTTTASITPKALTVTANNDSKNYDGTAYSGGNGVSYSGFVAGDTSADIGGTVGYGGSSQGAVAAGSYAITPGGLNSISGNYALGFANGALSIKTSDAGTVALGSEALVGAYDSAMQAVAGMGGASGGGAGGGGFGGSADAMAGTLAAAAAEAGNTDEN
jgi:filamentous hemagglutinin family protein